MKEQVVYGANLQLIIFAGRRPKVRISLTYE